MTQHLDVVASDSWTVSALAPPRARIVERRPLVYRHPPDAKWDISPHIRAASSMQRLRVRGLDELWIVSDDTRALARGRPDELRPVLLPADVGGLRRFGDDRGNKARKLDLEASFLHVDGPRALVVSFGSGSTDLRTRLVVIELFLDAGDAKALDVRIIDAAPLYAMLVATKTFSGSELNIEGTACVGDRLWLFQRGNGAPRDGLMPVDTVGEMDLRALLSYLEGAGPPPELLAIHHVDLGRHEGVRFGFTDACTMPDGRVCYVAAAEGSPNAVDDGPVVGCAIGWTAGRPDTGVLQQTMLLDETGAISTSKVEGLTWGDAPDELWAVVDADDTERPAELLRIQVDFE
jgi:hypothetical protein